MIVLKRVKEDLCRGCDMDGNCCDVPCYPEYIFKKLPVKNVVVIDGIAYEKTEGDCFDCDFYDIDCTSIDCENKIYKKLGKVVHHVNNNK